MSNHTDGPWAVEDALVDEGMALCVMALDKPEVIAFMSNGQDDITTHANAKLIAAAPDMLAALENITNNYDEVDAWRLVYAVIAKAKGEPA